MSVWRPMKKVSERTKKFKLFRKAQRDAADAYKFIGMAKRAVADPDLSRKKARWLKQQLVVNKAKFTRAANILKTLPAFDKPKMSRGVANIPKPPENLQRFRPRVEDDLDKLANKHHSLMPSPLEHRNVQDSMFEEGRKTEGDPINSRAVKKVSHLKRKPDESPKVAVKLKVNNAYRRIVMFESTAIAMGFYNPQSNQSVVNKMQEAALTADHDPLSHQRALSQNAILVARERLGITSAKTQKSWKTTKRGARKRATTAGKWTYKKK